MNPYEAPQTGDERQPVLRKRRLIVAVAMAVGIGMIVGGVSTFQMMQVQRARAMEAAMIRAEQAAQVKALRVREEALKAESEKESSAP